MMNTHHAHEHVCIARRVMLGGLIVGLVSPTLIACTPETQTFKSTDITGATYARDFHLIDHHGKQRGLVEFRGKVTVVFFGFTQCPDVCPTSMTTMAEVKRLFWHCGPSRLSYLLWLQSSSFITRKSREKHRLLTAWITRLESSFLIHRGRYGCFPSTELRQVCSRTTFRSC